MIVTDEEHVIGACLNNVSHLIDAISIDFNGKDEGTTKIIENFIKEKRIPGRVNKVIWDNDFGKSRTVAVRNAEKLIDEITPKLQNQPMSAKEWETFIKEKEEWYFMFMDADNKCVPESGDKFPIDKNKLIQDSYAVSMKQSTIIYIYQWMIKYDRKKKWKWMEPLHEYVCPMGDWKPTSGFLTGGHIVSGRDGTRNKNPLKYLDDAMIFEKQLIKEPDNARAMFYKAQSYRDAGRLQQAFDDYMKRVTMKGWVEEAYLSLVEAGKIKGMTEKDNPMKAYELFVRAFEIRPSRLEAPYYITEINRASGLYHFGWNFAKALINMDYPRNDKLFVDEPIHRWKFFTASAICALNTGDKASAEMLLKRSLTFSSMTKEEENIIKDCLNKCNS